MRLNRRKRMKDEGRVRAMMAKLKSQRMRKPESERDSGFSDGSSEHLSAMDQTDTEDVASLMVGGAALQGLSPMIIMNNVVLKQSGEPPASLKPWAFGPAVEAVQPQVVFLQPVVPQGSGSASKGHAPKGHASKGHASKGHAPKRRRHRKYLPILKSYPRIAPHPGDSGSSSASSDRSSAPLPGSASPADASTDSDPSSSGRKAEGGRSDNKIKRFCNTYNILRSSGLLDITLRTKELIRQNRRTQAELERLRTHTHMFTAALRTGDWAALHTHMLEENRRKEEENRRKEEENRRKEEENRDVGLK